MCFSSQVESALVEHAKVAEAAVVGVPHSIKGECLYCYITPTEGTEWSKDLQTELVCKGVEADRTCS